jgi:glycosyltransferase involved in cell wall biosynthesis
MKLTDIFPVLVLYKTGLAESKTMRSLAAAIKSDANLLVYDNGPARQYDAEIFKFGQLTIHYYHDPSNPGLSAAYNFALKLATEAQKQWIMLLDQDTGFNSGYIGEVERLDAKKLSGNIVAVLPNVVTVQSQRIISPCVVGLGAVTRPARLGAGVVGTKISGINSGTILNVSYLRSIGGFSQDYSLDMLDHWYFRKIFLDKKSVYLMNSVIHQDLSVAGGFEKNISLGRYKQLVAAEVAYIKDESLLSRLIFKLRLLARGVKQMRYVDKGYCKLTFAKLI